MSWITAFLWHHWVPQAAARKLSIQRWWVHWSKTNGSWATDSAKTKSYIHHCKTMTEQPMPFWTVKPLNCCCVFVPFWLKLCTCNTFTFTNHIRQKNPQLKKKKVPPSQFPKKTKDNSIGRYACNIFSRISRIGLLGWVQYWHLFLELKCESKRPSLSLWCLEGGLNLQQGPTVTGSRTRTSRSCLLHVKHTRVISTSRLHRNHFPLRNIPSQRVFVSTNPFVRVGFFAAQQPEQSIYFTLS